jgi:Na+/H+ antiporter NhaD/arsenite permease-like protein
MFLTARFFNEDIDEDPIMDYIRLIEFDTLMFFLGVLLVVGMLREIQVLNGVIELYSAMPHGLANFAMGILSAIIDNVPLTAALLKSGIEMNDTNWLLLTYSVGVGGSLLIIGSAAGIVAMSKIPSMTFNSYLRFLIPLFTAYCCGFAGAYLLGMWLF